MDGALCSLAQALPIVAHAENRTLAAVILIAALYDRPLHVAHVSLREEILLIRLAKQKGLVTCEVAPSSFPYRRHPRLGGSRGEVRPRLATVATGMPYGITWM